MLIEVIISCSSILACSIFWNFSGVGAKNTDFLRLFILAVWKTLQSGDGGHYSNALIGWAFSHKTLSTENCIGGSVDTLVYLKFLILILETNKEWLYHVIVLTSVEQLQGLVEYFHSDGIIIMAPFELNVFDVLNKMWFMENHCVRQT